MGVDMHQFPRPGALTLSVERTPVDEACPECGSSSVASYPVVGEEGWVDVVKCQDCLFSLSRHKAGAMGSITLLSDQL